jgi:hypothetical protein
LQQQQQPLVGIGPALMSARTRQCYRRVDSLVTGKDAVT